MPCLKSPLPRKHAFHIWMTHKMCFSHSPLLKREISPHLPKILRFKWHRGKLHLGLSPIQNQKCCLIPEIDCQWVSSKANLVGSQDVKYTSKFHGRSHTARLKANKSADDKQNSETWCTTDSFESETDWGSNIIAPCFPYMFPSRTALLPQLIMQAAATGRFCV